MKKEEEFSIIGNSYLRPKQTSALIANVVVFIVFGYCYMLNEHDYDFYYSIAQEDQVIEWTTMWSFLIASLGGVFGVILGWYQFKKFEWFYAGLALFCFIVAMEEISWGQRFFGYLAPDYFLENNFQQELTVHNMMDTSFRKFILKAILLGYGVILPLLMQNSALHRLLINLRFVIPPIALIPSFFLAFCLYVIYPWKLTGEVVELMMGICFLFTILFCLFDFKYIRRVLIGHKQTISLIGIILIIFLLGFGSAKGVNYNMKKSFFKTMGCRLELEAIKKDFNSQLNETGEFPIPKYVHTRLYTTAKKYNLNWLYENGYANIYKQEKFQKRAEFFIDPWNMPYWVQFKGNKKVGRVRLVFYSFGPNRKRDSDDWNIKGDDIGVVLMDKVFK